MANILFYPNMILAGALFIVLVAVTWLWINAERKYKRLKAGR